MSFDINSVHKIRLSFQKSFFKKIVYKMKKLLSSLLMTFALLLGTNIAIAQINTPAASPFCKMEQTVGLTDVTLEYSRPSVKGRILFVDIESFGKMWRTGANSATKITFSDDVKLEGQKVPAGTYAIYSIPDPTDWTIMLNSDLTIGGNVSNYKEATEVARFKVKGYKRSSSVETFTIDIGDIKSNSATIAIKWGNYFVPFKMEVNYDDTVMKQIEAAMGGPSRGEFYTAAKYYFDNGKDMDKAYEWAQKANEMGERYWQLRLEAQILAKMGKHQDAIAKLEKSSSVAKSAGNEGYAKANAKMAKEWARM